MSKIVVKRTSVVINNYEVGDCYPLEKSLSVYDSLTHQRHPKGLSYEPETKILYIPRGVDIGLIERWFQTSAMIDDSHDPFDEVSSILIGYLPKDDTQKQAMMFVLGQNKWCANRYKSQLSVNLNTGAGKTYVAVAMASFLKQRVIMITSTLEWIKQWKNKIIEYTNTTRDEIYIISGRPSIIYLLNGRKNLQQYKFILATHATISAYAAREGWAAVTKLFLTLKVGLKIYDEAHLNFDNICMVDFYTNTFRTLYLTATPARSAFSENLVYQLAFKNVPKIDLFNEDTDPHTKYISMSFNSHPTAAEVNRCRNPYGFDKLSYIRYLSTKPCFYKLLYILLDFVLPLNGKILIYIGLNDVIKTVHDWIVYNIPQLRGNVGIYNSTIPKEHKSEQLNNKIILSTMKSCGAAMDIDGLVCTINLAEPTGSVVLARQALGRTRARDTFYLDIIDTGFKAIRTYYVKLLPMFRKYAVSLHDIGVTDEDLDNRFAEITTKIRQEYEKSLMIADNRGKIKVIERVD